MAGDWRTLKLEVLAETKNFVKGMGDANKETESFSEKLKDFGAKAAVALAAAGVAAIAFGKKAIEAGEGAATANARIAQINDSMGLFGDSTDTVTQRLISYAEATARATGIDTNSIKITQAKLLTFKELAASASEVGGQFDRATKAAIDLASAGFGAAETNAVALGKALNDPIKGITALSRSGVTFTETEKERIKALVESNRVSEAQVLILEAIETQVGGTSEATANATDKINVGFTQVMEKIGLALLPTFEKFADFLLNTIIPNVEAFINGLTGQGGLTTSFTESQETAVKWGKKVAEFAKTVIKLKDEIILMGAVLTGVFVANKIAAGVMAIIALIKSLRAALAALRASAMIAGVAKMFALNPLLGVGAVAVGIGVMAAAKAAFGGDDNVSVGGVGGSGGNTVRPESLPSGFAAASPKISAASPATGSTGTGISGSLAPSISGISSNALQGLVPSGNAIPSGFDVAAIRRGEEADRPITINVNAPSAIDEEGFTRAVILALNNTDRRNGGGGSQLIL
jgi:hypothetical protein